MFYIKPFILEIQISKLKER